MLGCDLRNLPEDYRNLLLNKNLISLNQDAECRPPVLVTQRYENRSFLRQLETGSIKKIKLTFCNIAKRNKTVEDIARRAVHMRAGAAHPTVALENGGYAVGFFNLDDKTQYTDFFFEDAGIPVSSGETFPHCGLQCADIPRFHRWKATGSIFHSIP